MNLRLIASAAVIGGAALGGWWAEHWRLGAQIAAMKQRAAELQAENHRTEAMWSAHVIKLGEDANAEADRLRASVARADAASRSLHDAGSSRAAEATAAAGAGSPAAFAAVVLADVLRRADERAGELAAALDAARAAGLACQRFDEVTR